MSTRIERYLFIFWAIIGLAVMMHIAIFDFRIISAPISTQAQYTPDDAYYYYLTTMVLMGCFCGIMGKFSVLTRQFRVAQILDSWGWSVYNAIGVWCVRLADAK